MKKILLNSGMASGGIFYFIIGLLGLAIHLWTIAISFFYGGLLLATIALSLPFISELFWYFKSWGITNTFFNTYTLTITAYVVLSLTTLTIMGLLLGSGNKIDEKEEPPLV